MVGWPKNALKWLLASISVTDPEPRAWDRLFSKNRTGYITLKLKDCAEWKAGIWYRPAYASAYREDQELHIAEQIAVSAEGQSPTTTGDPIYLGVGLLIRWSEIEYIEFVESDSGG